MGLRSPEQYSSDLDLQPVVILTPEPEGVWAVLGQKEVDGSPDDLFEIWNHRTGQKQDYKWHNETRALYIADLRYGL